MPTAWSRALKAAPTHDGKAGGDFSGVANPGVPAGEAGRRWLWRPGWRVGGAARLLRPVGRVRRGGCGRSAVVSIVAGITIVVGVRVRRRGGWFSGSARVREVGEKAMDNGSTKVFNVAFLIFHYIQGLIRVSHGTVQGSTALSFNFIDFLRFFFRDGPVDVRHDIRGVELLRE